MLDCSALGHALSPLRPLLSLLFSPLPFLQRENFPLVPKGTSERARALLLEGNGKCARAGQEEVDATWKPAEAGVHLSGEARPGSRLLPTPPSARLLRCCCRSHS